MAVLAKLVAAAPRYVALLRSQCWTAEQFRSYTEARLEKVLAAAAKIPFYRERFGRSMRIGDFSALPTLRRADVLELNASVRSVYLAGMRLLADSSSGSTGLPVEFLFDNSHQRGRNAARARYLRANGWNPLQRTVWHYALNREDQPDADFVHSSISPSTRPTSSCYFELSRGVVRSSALSGSYSPAQSVSTIHSANAPVCFSARGLPTTTARPRRFSPGSVREAVTTSMRSTC